MRADDDPVRPAEQTFADVLNAFGLTGRKSRDRRAEDVSNRPSQPNYRDQPQPDDLQGGEIASSVRAYAWTGGRTRSDFQLDIETLVSTSNRAEHLINSLRTEHQSVARLCHYSKSVAEVGALLSLPLGVVRVLLGDMASLGLIDVHKNPTAGGEQPSMELLERVLNGLANLRPVSQN
jgi:Protein of unknown function (DUF742)